MTETGYGPGGYAFTEARTPVAPVLDGVTSESIDIAIGVDGNGEFTTYALWSDTLDAWLDSDGAPSVAAVWRSRVDWAGTTVGGLAAETAYSFAAVARNAAGVETEAGPSATAVTWGSSSATVTAGLTVTKATSTITAPSFMTGLETRVRVAGKDLNDLGFHVTAIGGLDMPRVPPDEELVPGDHAWRVRDGYFPPKRIVLEGIVSGVSSDDLRLRLAYLKSFFATFEGMPWRSSATVRFERSDMPGRHWDAVYDSLEVLESLGGASGPGAVRVRAALRCPSPFAVANETVRAVVDPAAGAFTPLTLGTAPSDAVHVVTGPCTDPSITLGDMIFHCCFDDGLSYADADNGTVEGVYTPAGSEAGAYRTTDSGTGLLVAGTDTVSFAVPGNPADGAWVMAVVPQWASHEPESDVAVLEHRAGADDLARLWWDASERAWAFTKRAGGADVTVTSGPQAFTAGTRIVLGITWDGTNAGGMRLFVDGETAATGDDTTPLASAPATLTLHAGDGTMQPNALADMVYGWSRMLSADEMLRIATDPSSVRNHNAVITCDATLDEGDTLTLDSRRGTAVLFDRSAGTRTNALASVDGAIPALIPGRRRTATDTTQTMVRTGSAAGAIEIRYRRRYL